MKIIIILTISGLTLAIGLATGCSPATNTTTNTNAVNKTTLSTTAPSNVARKSEDDTPASVKAVFPDAQSFTKQHKDIPTAEIAKIEKESGGKVPDTDHHSYLAFSTTGGARKQVGAATIIDAGGKSLVVVYETKEGNPYIKEIRADSVAADFLKQFAGKGHDDKFQMKAAGGETDAVAKAIDKAVQIDVLTMQMLYGTEHKH